VGKGNAPLAAHSAHTGRSACYDSAPNIQHSACACQGLYRARAHCPMYRSNSPHVPLYTHGCPCMAASSQRPIAGVLHMNTQICTHTFSLQRRTRRLHCQQNPLLLARPPAGVSASSWPACQPSPSPPCCFNICQRNTQSQHTVPIPYPYSCCSCSHHTWAGYKRQQRQCANCVTHSHCSLCSHGQRPAYESCSTQRCVQAGHVPSQGACTSPLCQGPSHGAQPSRC
jgi:hypothetical protein